MNGCGRGCNCDTRRRAHLPRAAAASRASKFHNILITLCFLSVKEPLSVMACPTTHSLDPRYIQVHRRFQRFILAVVLVVRLCVNCEKKFVLLSFLTGTTMDTRSCKACDKRALVLSLFFQTFGYFVEQDNEKKRSPKSKSKL